MYKIFLAVLAAIVLAAGVARADEYSEMAQFAQSICGDIPEGSLTRTAIQGKVQANAGLLANIVTGSGNVGGSKVDEIYKGIPFDKLPDHIPTVSMCKIELVKILVQRKSSAEEGAERAQACEVRHSMKTASEKTESNETIPAKFSGDHDQEVEHIVFRSCTWPRSRYADLDGYFEINVTTVDGPGDSEASGTNRADRISARCPQLRVAYGFGHMGDYKNLAPFVMTADTIATAYGEHWTRPDGNVSGYLPFYPDRGEFVVLHNDNDVISIAECM
jgi:hypothetical protein